MLHPCFSGPQSPSVESGLQCCFTTCLSTPCLAWPRKVSAAFCSKRDLKHHRPACDSTVKLSQMTREALSTAAYFPECFNILDNKHPSPCPLLLSFPGEAQLSCSLRPKQDWPDHSVCHGPSRPHVLGIIPLGNALYRLIKVADRRHAGRDQAVQLLPVARCQKPLMELALHKLLELPPLLPREDKEGVSSKIHTINQRAGEMHKAGAVSTRFLEHGRHLNDFSMMTLML